MRKLLRNSTWMKFHSHGYSWPIFPNSWTTWRSNSSTLARYTAKNIISRKKQRKVYSKWDGVVLAKVRIKRKTSNKLSSICTNKSRLTKARIANRALMNNNYWNKEWTQILRRRKCLKMVFSKLKCSIAVRVSHHLHQMKTGSRFMSSQNRMNKYCSSSSTIRAPWCSTEATSSQSHKLTQLLKRPSTILKNMKSYSRPMINCRPQWSPRSNSTSTMETCWVVCSCSWSFMGLCFYMSPEKTLR